MNTQIHSGQLEGFKYQQVVDLISEQLDQGSLRPGDRLPSLRHLSGKLKVSVPTVRQAYLELERLGQISARPKSGYFIEAQRKNRLVSGRCQDCKPVEVECRELIDQVYDAIHQPDVLPLGIANPTMALPATKTLNRAMKRVMSRAEARSISYATTIGEVGLRRQIAYRYLNLGGSVDPNQIIITNGAQEALALALKSVARPGDVIAIESPSYHGLLELIESMDMMALDIKTCAVEGVDLPSLEQALIDHDVAACIFSSSLSNPLGFLSTEEHRRSLVALIEKYDVPLIEDDVYAELIFDGSRQTPAQFYSTKGLVLTCSSFSKTVAPGFRIGWLLPGNYFDTAHKLKRAVSCSSGMLQQLTLSEMLVSGDYDRHLQRLLPVLKTNAERMTAQIARAFPPETAVSQPKGGSVLWLELPENVDSEVLFRYALDNNISIMPGSVFAADYRYRNFIRLSFGHPWSEAIETAIDLLGNKVRQMAT
jgi:DNA-binding transcriptional MocR family regulator